MKDVKIIFFDIDGTLLDFGAKTITPKMEETLLKLRQKGIKLCIATGRSPMHLPAFTPNRFDAWLTFNGSYCYDATGPLFCNTVRYEDIQTVIQNATKLGRPVAVATKDRMAANGWDQDLSDYYAFTGQPLVVSPEFDLVCREGVYQVLLGCRQEDHQRIVEGTTNSKIAAWWDRAADVIPKNGGKGLGVEKILEHFGFTKEEAMAFGDGNNDLELISAVGTGVAMENGSDRLKAIADDICGPVSQDGIYQYCLAKGLI